MHITIRNAFDLASKRNLPEVRIFIDVFRASTTTLALLDAGVKTLLIANSLDLIENLSRQGYLVVSEVFHLGLDNSPTLIKKLASPPDKAVLKTANLTTAIEANAFEGTMLIAAFNNLTAIQSHLKAHHFKNIEIIPAGHMNTALPTFEDTHCAEVLARSLIEDRPAHSNIYALSKHIEFKTLEKPRKPHFLGDMALAVALDTSAAVPKVFQGPIAHCFEVKHA